MRTRSRLARRCLLVPVELRRHSLQRSVRAARDRRRRAARQPGAGGPAAAGFRFPLAERARRLGRSEPGGVSRRASAAAIAGLPGWQVRPSVVLSLFSFAKGVIFQDLQDNAERIKAHPFVQALGGRCRLRCREPSCLTRRDAGRPARSAERAITFSMPTAANGSALRRRRAARASC